MIDEKSLSAEWLAEKRKQYKKDPGIIEGMIYALYLLDQLRATGLDFIFKGGTSLISTVPMYRQKQGLGKVFQIQNVRFCWISCFLKIHTLFWQKGLSKQIGFE